jgi:hypothetical protein
MHCSDISTYIKKTWTVLIHFTESKILSCQKHSHSTISTGTPQTIYREQTFLSQHIHSFASCMYCTFAYDKPFLIHTPSFLGQCTHSYDIDKLSSHSTYIPFYTVRTLHTSFVRRTLHQDSPHIIQTIRRPTYSSDSPHIPQTAHISSQSTNIPRTAHIFLRNLTDSSLKRPHIVLRHSTLFLLKLTFSFRLWRAAYIPGWRSNQLGVPSNPVQYLYISCYVTANNLVLSYLLSRLLPQWWTRSGCTLCTVQW